MIELYINGLSGRMGKTLVNLIQEKQEFEVIDDLSSADVVIDFSHPSSTEKILKNCIKHNVPLVIGTTGIEKEMLDEINKASKILPIVLAANMSIGIHQLKDSLKKFIKGNTKKLNCLIEETHHSNKLDEPSGTAIEIENLIKDEDKNNYINLAKTVSYREDDVSGIHKITFKEDDVSYIFKHNAISRDIFGNGAIYCAKRVLKLKPDLYSFEKIIN
tara:strand:+ start:626 stop:1276 length:651 start_codon:yes stop_codon:yes gene_type:complete